MKINAIILGIAAVVTLVECFWLWQFHHQLNLREQELEHEKKLRRRAEQEAERWHEQYDKLINKAKINGGSKK